MQTLKEKIENLIKELDKKSDDLYHQAHEYKVDALVSSNRNTKAWVYAEVADRLEEILEGEKKKSVTIITNSKNKGDK